MQQDLLKLVMPASKPLPQCTAFVADGSTASFPRPGHIRFAPIATLAADLSQAGAALVLMLSAARLHMPELMAWRCSVCGHVETIEVIQPDAQKVA
jgi:hypothetical protein